jgi:hypothetical protein
MALSLEYHPQLKNVKMKNILKISLVAFGTLLIGSTVKGQDLKKDAATTSGQLEAPAAESRTGAQPAATTSGKDTKAGKQEPVKSTKQDPKTAKKDTADTTQTGGGTRMAITEQGMPKKNKNKAKSASTTTTTTPPAQKEKPKN